MYLGTGRAFDHVAISNDAVRRDEKATAAGDRVIPVVKGLDRHGRRLDPFDKLRQKILPPR